VSPPLTDAQFEKIVDAPRISAVTTLILDECIELTDVTVSGLIGILSDDLMDLSLWNTPKITMAVWDNIAACRNLVTLRCSHWTGDISGIGKHLSRLTKLTDLTIGFFNDLGLLHIEAALLTLAQLRQLDIVECPLMAKMQGQLAQVVPKVAVFNQRTNTTTGLEALGNISMEGLKMGWSGGKWLGWAASKVGLAGGQLAASGLVASVGAVRAKMSKTEQKEVDDLNATMSTLAALSLGVNPSPPAYTATPIAPRARNSERPAPYAPDSYTIYPLLDNTNQGQPSNKPPPAYE
jgi:hypothetical protein